MKMTAGVEGIAKDYFSLFSLFITLEVKNNEKFALNSLKVDNPIDQGLTLFSKMVIQARNDVNQDEIGIATLLGISVEYFKEIENGLLPPNELTRKICTLFRWNFKQINQKINAQSKILFHNDQQFIDSKKIKFICLIMKNFLKKNLNPPFH